MSLGHVASSDTHKINSVIHFLLQAVQCFLLCPLHENSGLKYYSVSNQPFESPLMWLATPPIT